MISITKLLVRDAAKKSTTLVDLLAGPVSVDQIPDKANIEVVFSGKISKAYFYYDQVDEHQEWGAPYYVANDTSPLTLTAGSHSLRWHVDAQTDQTIPIVITAGKPKTIMLGTNGYSIDDPNCKPDVIIPFYQQCGIKTVRRWLEGITGDHIDPAKWDLSRKLHAAGIGTTVVINPLNSRKKYMAASSVDLLAALNQFPLDAGIEGIHVYNECNGTGYYRDSMSNLALSTQTVYNWAHPHGIQTWSPSFIGSIPTFQSFLVACEKLSKTPIFDIADYHSYFSTAQSVYNDINQFSILAKGIGFTPGISECGIRGSSSNIAGWAQQLTLLFQMIRNIPEKIMPFPGYWMVNSPDPLAKFPAPFDANWLPNGAFHDAWKTFAV